MPRRCRTISHRKWHLQFCVDGLIDRDGSYLPTYPSRLEACKAAENNPDVVICDIGWKKEMERRKRSTIKIYYSVLCPIAWSVRAFSRAQGAAAAPKKRNYILLNVTGSRARNHKFYIPARERAFGQWRWSAAVCEFHSFFCIIARNKVWPWIYSYNVLVI